MQGNDLEAIVTLLELGAISLTNKEGDLFTEDELIKAAQQYEGDAIKLDINDVKIVLPFFRKVLGKRNGRYYLR